MDVNENKEKTSLNGFRRFYFFCTLLTETCVNYYAELAQLCKLIDANEWLPKYNT